MQDLAGNDMVFESKKNAVEFLKKYYSDILEKFILGKIND